jgi:general L-amino acid transport system substrate-binding protein
MVQRAGEPQLDGGGLTVARAAAAAALALLCFMGPGLTAAHAGKDLDAIRARGKLICGVGNGTAGFFTPDTQGNWTGLSVDVCRAVSAALFGDASKVSYVPLTAQQRFTAVQSGEVDVIVVNATHTLSRDTQLGLDFPAIYYYDGQGFLVPKKLGVKRVSDLSGATFCVAPGSTSELNLADYARTHRMTIKTVVIEKADELRTAFFAGRCDVYTSESSALAAVRAASVPSPQKPEDYELLPEIISKEPLGPAVRHGDNQFADIVRWSFFAMLEAEEQGITSDNVDAMLNSDNPTVRRFLGVTPGMGKALGVDDKWAYAIVKQVGNYAQSFDRNVGKDSVLKLDRGLNNLWTRGGVQYAMPVR